MKITLIIPLLVALMLSGRAHAGGYPLFPHHGCDGDREWSEYNGNCYKFMMYHLSHGDMITMCQETGPRFYNTTSNSVVIYTYLADVLSQGENDFVSEVVTGGERAWIGAERQEDDTFSWVRIDGNTPLGQYQHWKPGNEPNNHGGNEDCVEINRGPPGMGMWNDIRCTVSLPGVCKYNIARYAARVPGKE